MERFKSFMLLSNKDYESLQKRFDANEKEISFVLKNGQVHVLKREANGDIVSQTSKACMIPCSVLEKKVSGLQYCKIKGGAKHPLRFCFVCQNLTTRKCSGCKAVYYCSRECQAHDWKIHQEKCSPPSPPFSPSLPEKIKKGEKKFKSFVK